MRCHFCFAEGDVPKLSKEHLLSKPVAEAFGLDRTGAFGQLNIDDSVVFARLDDVAVKFVCERCNNTWMNALEHEMAALADWTRSPDQSLTPALAERGIEVDHVSIYRSGAELCKGSGSREVGADGP